MKQVREDQLIAEAYQTVSERTEFKPSNIVPDANTLTAFTSMLEKEGFPKPHKNAEVFNLLQSFLQTIPKENQTIQVKKALQVALQNVHVDSGLVTDYFDYEAGFNTPIEDEEKESNYRTSGGVTDEFDSVLQAAGYPKNNYETAEIYNLIANYENKVDPRDRNTHLYNSIVKALKLNDVEPDLVADYLHDKAGASDNYHEDEEKKSNYENTVTHTWRGIDFNGHREPIGYIYLGYANDGQEIPKSDDWVEFASSSDKEHYLSPKLKMWFSTDSSG